jgi:hypothetical protein
MCRAALIRAEVQTGTHDQRGDVERRRGPGLLIGLPGCDDLVVVQAGKPG